MSLDEIQGAPSAFADPVEVLIHQARLRQRRRRRRTLLLVAVALIVGLATTVAVAASRARHPSGQRTPSGSAPAVLTGVQPEAPAALAAGPNGALYLIDTGRDQILRYTSGQGFTVVAGTGRVGRSTHGSARRADLRLTWASGLALNSEGDLYFTEDGRVVRLRPDGTIAVVAGGGRASLTPRSVPARDADLTPDRADLGGLTFGPDGELYVGTWAGVYRLGGTGELRWVVGTPFVGDHFPAGVKSLVANPAAQIDFSPAANLAFDRAGDLFVSGDNCWCLYEKTARGSLRFVENLRGQGGEPGSLATGADGTVVTASGLGLQTIAHGATHPLNATWPRSRQPFRFYPAFGNGVAAGAGGAIYVDTDAGDAMPNQGLLEVQPRSRRAVWLWAQPGNQR